MREVAVALTYLDEPPQPREDGLQVSAVKEVAASLTIGASVGLALAWGSGLSVLSVALTL